MTTVIDITALVILAVVIAEDLRRFRIRNVSVAALAGLALCMTALDGGAELVLAHGLFAAMAFALLAAAFAAGLMGAGDAKLLTAACLWVGPEKALVYSLCLSALAICYGGFAALGIVPAKRLAGRLKIPFAPSIAGAWIAVIALSLAWKDLASQ